MGSQRRRVIDILFLLPQVECWQRAAQPKLSNRPAVPALQVGGGDAAQGDGQGACHYAGQDDQHMCMFATPPMWMRRSPTKRRMPWQKGDS
eukprot:3417569-Pyramimonas_sp.AAC.1